MHKEEDGTFVAWQLLGPGAYQYKVYILYRRMHLKFED